LSQVADQWRDCQAPRRLWLDSVAEYRYIMYHDTA